MKLCIRIFATLMVVVSLGIMSFTYAPGVAYADRGDRHDHRRDHDDHHRRDHDRDDYRRHHHGHDSKAGDVAIGAAAGLVAGVALVSCARGCD